MVSAVSLRGLKSVDRPTPFLTISGIASRVTPSAERRVGAPSFSIFASKASANSSTVPKPRTVRRSPNHGPSSGLLKRRKAGT
ncbi:hypothetical protein D3C87_1835160 [compost metagenome]